MTETRYPETAEFTDFVFVKACWAQFVSVPLARAGSTYLAWGEMGMASNQLEHPYKRILIGSSLVVALLLIFCTATVEFLPEKSDAIGLSFKATKALLNAVSAVTSSILAAMLATLAINWYSDLRRQETKAKFMRFFSISVGGEVIIVLPKFKVEVAEQNDEDRGANELCLKELTEVDRACVSWNDLIAARHISAMFAEYGTSVPKIYFDDDVWKTFYDKTYFDDRGNDDIRKCTSFIVIGLFSNAIVTELSRSLEANRSFKISSREEAKNSERWVEIAPMQRESPESLHAWYQETANTQSKSGNFGLLSRVSMPGDRRVLIVGGGRARSTRKMASYLRRHWIKLHDLSEPERNQPLQDKFFSIGFIVPPKFEGKENLGGHRRKEKVDPIRGATYYS